jgi:hypothetical protein
MFANFTLPPLGKLPGMGGPSISEMPVGAGNRPGQFVKVNGTWQRFDARPASTSSVDTPRIRIVHIYIYIFICIVCVVHVI